MKKRTNREMLYWITQGAAIAALYAVLTLIFAPVSFQAVQIRVAEAMTILPMFTPAAVPGLFLGCLLGPVFRTLYYMYGMAGQVPLTMLKGHLNAVTSVDQLVEMAGGYNDIFTELARRVVVYEKNYDRLIKDILAINPDVDIYYVGMYNTFADVQPADSDIVVQFRNQGDVLSGELKDYVARRSPYANRVHYVDVGHVEVWPSVPVDNIMFYMTFLIHCHPDYTGHKQIANKIIASMKRHGTI